MEEALMLFDQICNSQWFVNTSMIMFMNKTDIFRNKIKTSSIKFYFPDYKGKDRRGWRESKKQKENDGDLM